MYTRRFFIGAILFLLALLLLSVGVVMASSAVMSMQLAGALLLPYGCFAVLLTAWSFNQSPASLRSAAYRLPIVFLGFQMSYFGLRYWFGVSYATDLMGLGSIFVITSIYIIIFGYLYVFIVEQYYISYLFQKRAQNTAKLASQAPLPHQKSTSQSSEQNNKLRC